MSKLTVKLPGDNVVTVEGDGLEIQVLVLQALVKSYGKDLVNQGVAHSVYIKPVESLSCGCPQCTGDRA